MYFYKLKQSTLLSQSLSLSLAFGKLKHYLKLFKNSTHFPATMNTFKPSKPLSFRLYKNIKFWSQNWWVGGWSHTNICSQLVASSLLWRQSYITHNRSSPQVPPSRTHLEADTEGEGECDDDDEPGDGGQEPAAHPDARLRLVPGHGPRHGGLLLAVDTDGAHVRSSLAVLVTSIGVHLHTVISS